jgi:hypothetical protein
MKQNMSRSKIILPWFAISLSLFVASCTAKSFPPPVNIADEYVNQQIRIRVAPYSNTLKTSDPVSLELKYNSNNTIVFPNNYNLKIFERSKDKWLEVKEEPTVRLPEGDITLAPNIMLPAVEVIFVSPDLKDLSRSYQLRIYVIGEMQTDNGKQNVAAYVEFELKP